MAEENNPFGSLQSPNLQQTEQQRQNELSIYRHEHPNEMQIYEFLNDQKGYAKSSPMLGGMLVPDQENQLDELKEKLYGIKPKEEQNPSQGTGGLATNNPGRDAQGLTPAQMRKLAKIGPNDEGAANDILNRGDLTATLAKITPRKDEQHLPNPPLSADMEKLANAAPDESKRIPPGPQKFADNLTLNNGEISPEAKNNKDTANNTPTIDGLLAEINGKPKNPVASPSGAYVEAQGQQPNAKKPSTELGKAPSMEDLVKGISIKGVPSEQTKSATPAPEGADLHKDHSGPHRELTRSDITFAQGMLNHLNGDKALRPDGVAGDRTRQAFEKYAEKHNEAHKDEPGFKPIENTKELTQAGVETLTKDYQGKKGLDADGFIGPKTQEAIMHDDPRVKASIHAQAATAKMFAAHGHTRMSETNDGLQVASQTPPSQQQKVAGMAGPAG